MKGRDKLQNLDHFAAVSRRILQNGLRNLAKFFAQNCGPYSLCAHTGCQCAKTVKRCMFASQYMIHWQWICNQKQNILRLPGL